MKPQNRIAVCISGQVRTSHEKLAEIAAQAEKIGADVFISVWADRGGKTIESGPRHIAVRRMFGGDLSVFLPRGLFFKLEEICPAWQDILPERPPVTVQELEGVFQGAIVETEPDRPELDLPGDKNSLRMLYKIHRCNLLKRAYEAKNGFRYDRVIRVRPDMLVDFAKLAAPELGPKDLLVTMRRGESLHDKYWAGSSDTDDLMADLFIHARDHRRSDWKGIHEELTSYIRTQGLNPVPSMCTLSDFADFGEYTLNERCGMAKRFQQQLKTAAVTVNETLLLEVLEKARGFVCAGEALALNPESPATLAGLIAAPTNGLIDPWQLLPIVSLAAACDLQTPPALRARLAYYVLLDDALNWKAWYKFRALHVVNLLPDHGAELTAHISGPFEATMPDRDNDPVLLRLWAERLGGSSAKDIKIARHALADFLLGSRHVRFKIHDFLKEEGRLTELLTYAELVAGHFPEQRNAGVFLAVITKLAAGQTLP
ncbi:MAG: hypothetical protein L3J37_03055 [Rhodobacteraceae bacterium]|nr:hypothetical protein [Paracoccaceae bacterium]